MKHTACGTGEAFDRMMARVLNASSEPGDERLSQLLGVEL